ncbi:hypothetical protein L0Y34_01465 [Candidatus Parcubacteria bacterium]|nr:hypothetical protein [Candidatus Parcubacteria bacterium]
MALAIALLVVAVLLVWFLYLTAWEKKREVRVCSRARSALDRKVSYVVHKVQSGEAGTAFKREARALAEYLGHEITHVALAGVRVIERLLTRAMRYFRGRRGVE